MICFNKLAVNPDSRARPGCDVKVRSAHVEQLCGSTRQGDLARHLDIIAKTLDPHLCGDDGKERQPLELDTLDDDPWSG